MSLPKPQPKPQVADSTRLPTQDELPYSDGDKLESERHVLAMVLLISSLKPWLRRRYRDTGEGGYVGGDMFLYFSPEQVKNRHFRGPDVLVALGVEPGERKSWVSWQEGKGPDVVIELLSGSTQRPTRKSSRGSIATRPGYGSISGSIPLIRQTLPGSRFPRPSEHRPVPRAQPPSQTWHRMTRGGSRVKFSACDWAPGKVATKASRRSGYVGTHRRASS